MTNQTIVGLNTIASPSSAALLWVSDPNASPQDRSLSLGNLLTYLNGKGMALIAQLLTKPTRTIVITSGALGSIAPTGDTEYIFTAASSATLPVSPAFTGQRLTFKSKLTATSTITAGAGQTIGATGSTSFLLYRQEDYVTLEWDGVSIWYVVATNGPLYYSDQTADIPCSTQNSWAAMTNGLSLGSIPAGVYDAELACSVTLSGGIPPLLNIALGNGTTPISEMVHAQTGTVGVTTSVKVTAKGFVLLAPATIQGIYYGNSASHVIPYAVGTMTGRIVLRRIG